MSHILLKKWAELKNSIGNKSDSITPLELINVLLVWAMEVKAIKDLTVKQLYHDYLEFFEKIDPNEYVFNETWYSFEEMLNVDILGSNVDSYERPVVIIRNVLWELLVFKSNINCPNCNYDNLRIFTDISKEQLFYCCDNCGYNLNAFGKKHSYNSNLIPITAKLVELHDLKPSW